MTGAAPRFRRIPILAMALLLSGCESVGYYGQAISGQLTLMLHRTPLERVIEDAATPAQVSRRLQFVADVREYAAARLGLPVGDSYSTYVDTGRPYAVWNVFATPELSLIPLTWCFPVAGCVAYRGYFVESRARAFADRLRREGNDVYVGGVAAYSTLGWFSDPVLNTFLARSDTALAALIFHEVAHKICYLPGDTTFNESFATTVEVEGVRRWLLDRGEASRYQEFASERERRSAFVRLVAAYREKLSAVYAGTGDAATKRAEKERVIGELRTAYRELQRSWGGEDDFGAWIAGGINNAKLVSIASYNDLVPALQRLLEDEQGDLQRFTASVAGLTRLPAGERKARLDELARRAGANSPSLR